jgi:cellulose synthase/poly-beta-1,6-N-acetylglucosamine synthase-like glycosyltransferase
MNASLHILRGNKERLDAAGVTPLTQVLADKEWVSEDTLARAIALQANTGAALADVLVANGWATAAQVAQATAEQWGLGYVDLAADPAEPATFEFSDAALCLKHRILPWRTVGDLRIYVTATPERAPEALSELEADNALAFVSLAEPAALDQALLDAFGAVAAEQAARRTPPKYSVRTLGLRRVLLVAGVLGALSAAWAAGAQVLLAVALALFLFNAATMTTRLAALVAGSCPPRREMEPDGAVLLAEHRPMPRISLLIPLYDEAQMVSGLIEALSAIDYPRELTEVKLLLESNDFSTCAAVDAAKLPGWITPLILPPGEPRTKPRALNLALDLCKGDVIGILDAEDRPDPGQLMAVAEHLRSAPAETACVQCRLSWYNARENWLTRCFQIEYAIWFDVLLGGWQRLGLPVPLGGTSVYFRSKALGELGGWDAHNVTEDADLGMRLARRGYRCDVLYSTTQEEANCRILPWVRQRSRWLKGYMMTWLVHMRDPKQLWHDLGATGFLGLNILFLGGAVTYLAMPIFWLALVMTLTTGQSVFGDALPLWALNVLGWSLVAGQAVMLLCATVALWRRRALDLLMLIPTLPVYWTLGALAAWKAVIEVASAPYYWDKTRHGVSRRIRR